MPFVDLTLPKLEIQKLQQSVVPAVQRASFMANLPLILGIGAVLFYLLRKK